MATKGALNQRRPTFRQAKRRPDFDDLGVVIAVYYPEEEGQQNTFNVTCDLILLPSPTDSWQSRRLPFLPRVPVMWPMPCNAKSGGHFTITPVEGFLNHVQRVNNEKLTEYEVTGVDGLSDILDRNSGDMVLVRYLYNRSTPYIAGFFPSRDYFSTFAPEASANKPEIFRSHQGATVTWDRDGALKIRIAEVPTQAQQSQPQLSFKSISVVGPNDEEWLGMEKNADGLQFTLGGSAAWHVAIAEETMDTFKQVILKLMEAIGSWVNADFGTVATTVNGIVSLLTVAPPGTPVVTQAPGAPLLPIVPAALQSYTQPQPPYGTGTPFEPDGVYGAGYIRAKEVHVHDARGTGPTGTPSEHS